MDHRDLANVLPKRLEVDGNSVVFEMDDENYRLPFKYQVCPTCDGKGSHVNPSIDSHGISADEFYEDPDFGESYFRGDYDVTCYECKGDRVVPGFDIEIFSETEKEIYEKYQDLIQEDLDYIQECEAERRMGA